VARYLPAPDRWRGKVFGGNRAAIPEGKPLARLTYNPRFREPLDRIDEFIARELVPSFAPPRPGETRSRRPGDATVEVTTP